MMPIYEPPDPHQRRWMLFIDGENFTIRAQKFAELRDFPLHDGSHFMRDVYVWIPDVQSTEALTNGAPVPVQVQHHATRAYYYTSLVADELKLQSVRRALHDLGFQPEVFKKRQRETKAKGVDIALAKDFLVNAFLNNFDVATLIAGDADYVPLVNEVKRLGKTVYVVFFGDEGCGMSDELSMAADRYLRLDSFFEGKWRKSPSPTQEQPQATTTTTPPP